MTNAYVLVEHRNGALLPATAELITAARVFGQVTAVVVGGPGAVQPLAQPLAELGAAVIYAAEAEDYAQRVILPEVDALHAIAAQTPGPILVDAGAHGNEIAGRLAARLASGVLCDVTAVHADRTATQSIFGDTIEVTAAVGGTSPIYTLRPGAVEAAPAPAAGQVLNFALPAATQKDVAVQAFTPAPEADRPPLVQANVVVAGGRGVEDNFQSIAEPLADALGGAVGATRDAVDLGYYPAQYQIGQTGVTVSPNLYIGLGVSGAIQHTSGMQTAKKIVVINNDEDAPFFQIADLGVVGDLHEIVPLLIAEIQKRVA